ncbi:MAG: FeoB-associated Cys-rich membrane protein [Lachnospiraceae bacterium]|nr:FeoB-associated Cys-rich membrane protein [Lachnospiraceae bacterium]
MGTIVIGLLILGIVFLAARSLWRDKKAGKCCGCSCGCGKNSRKGHGKSSGASCCSGHAEPRP